MYCLHCGKGPYKNSTWLEKHIWLQHGGKEYKGNPEYDGFEYGVDWGFEKDVQKLGEAKEQ